MRIVIVDDDTNLRKKLIKQINSALKYKLDIFEAGNVKSGVEAITNNNPDIVFLDIEMPDGTGFNIMDRIENRNFKIVFISSYDFFTKKAYSFGADGYLVKPVKVKDVVRIISNAK